MIFRKLEVQEPLNARSLVTVIPWRMMNEIPNVRRNRSPTKTLPESNQSVSLREIKPFPGSRIVFQSSSSTFIQSNPSKPGLIAPVYKELKTVCQSTATTRSGPIVMFRPYNSQASSDQSGHREIKPQKQSVITPPNIMP